MKLNVLLAGLALALAPLAVDAFGTGCRPRPKVAATAFPPRTPMPVNLKVAMLGDSGVGPTQRAVLEMVKEWGADFVIHLGDFDYNDNPNRFFVNIHDVLGEDYPYFASIGNHDEDEWDGSSGYAALLTQQLQNANVTQYCTGEIGVNHACYYRGLYFVMSGVGTQGSGHVQFIEDAFDAVPAKWRLCGWHKNQRLFQLNTKSDETGYAVYDTCREYGAIVATGHEHSYSRTYTMSSFSQQTIKDFNATVTLAPGQTFAFVSGLGGQSIRSWDENLANNPWWAAKAASNNRVRDGALFCTFNVDGDEDRASCFFEDRTGARFDSFDVVSTVPGDQVVRSRDSCPQPFFDLAVASGADDVFEQADGRVLTHRRTINLAGSSAAEPSVAGFRFVNVPVAPHAKIEHAQLQLLGVASDLQRSSVQLRVSVELVADAAPFDATAARAVSSRRFTRSLPWTWDAEDFEVGSVWTSVDIAPLLQEVVNLPGWKAGNSVVVSVSGMSPLVVASFERSACQAPSLSIELAREC